MSRQYAVYVADPAADDLARCLEYISVDLQSPMAAARLLADMGRFIQSLASFPSRFRLLPRSPWRERGYHCASVRNYIVIYKVDEARGEVFVSRVFHSLQNWEAMLETLP